MYIPKCHFGTLEYDRWHFGRQWIVASHQNQYGDSDSLARGLCRRRDLKKHFNICSKKWSTQKQERSRWNVPVFYEAISIKVEIAIDG